MRPVSTEDVVGVPVQAGVLARALARHADYRVLSRLKPLSRSALRNRGPGELSVCVIDVETTGLDFREDRIIELAVRTVVINGHGRIVEAGRARSWLEDPGRPIPPEITVVTGLRDEDVKGKVISDGEAYSMIADADIRLAHNAAFDRPFVEARLGLGREPWICSLNDIDWKVHGFEGRSLSQLLATCGWFFDAHRAAGDVEALIHLLDHDLENGRTVMRELIMGAGQSTWRICAVGADFDASPSLRKRRYRWDAARKTWWKDVRQDDLSDECDWVTQVVYQGRRLPELREITWRDRYSADTVH